MNADLCNETIYVTIDDCVKNGDFIIPTSPLGIDIVVLKKVDASDEKAWFDKRLTYYKQVDVVNHTHFFYLNHQKRKETRK